MCFFFPLVYSLEYSCSSGIFPSDRTGCVSSRSCTVTNKPTSFTYTVASSFVCTFSLAVMTFVGFLVARIVSSSAGFKSFLLSMCKGAPESTTNSLSSCLKNDGEGRHQTSEGEKDGALFWSRFRSIWYNFLAKPHAFLRAHRSFTKVSSWIQSSTFGAKELRSWGRVSEITSSHGFLSQTFAYRKARGANRTRLFWSQWIGCFP